MLTIDYLRDKLNYVKRYRDYVEAMEWNPNRKDELAKLKDQIAVIEFRINMLEDLSRG